MMPCYLKLPLQPSLLHCLNYLGRLAMEHQEVPELKDSLMELVALAGRIVKFMDENALRRHLWIWSRLGELVWVNCQRVLLVGRQGNFWVILRGDQKCQVDEGDID
jgi:hypothetical protein